MAKKQISGLHISGQEVIRFQDRSAVLKAVKRVYKAADLGNQMVSLCFVSDEEIRELNYHWRKKNAPTDVLSFSAQEGLSMPGLENILGDIVISIETAECQAKELGHLLQEEIAVLFAHGIFHLLGYDHERSHDEAVQQAQCEMALLELSQINPELALTGRSL